MLRQLFGLVVLVGAASVAGCTEVEVKPGRPSIGGPNTTHPKSTREQDLRDAVQKDPKDHVAWFELGQFYYDGGEWDKAALAYERGNALMCPDPEKASYTGGYFCLALTYVHMKPARYDLAMKNLDMIAWLEPSDPKTASFNANFREAHRIRGAIYYYNNNPKPAKRELLKYLELGGDEDSVSEILESLKDE
jgi:tetratricopeptide (TPR) repeat protein